MTLSRREFLLRSGCGALSAAALASGIDRFGLVNAYAQGTGYKALVCIFLGGGNDGNNTVVPLDPAGYAAYASVRNPAGLAIAQDSLLPIMPKSIGKDFGLHPSLAAVHPLFASGQLAIVSNVGPLIQPLSKADYQGGAPRPYQLFSHADQISQWQTSVSSTVSGTGWGGRIADTFGAGPSGFPLLTALAGGVFTRGQTTSPLTVAPAPTALNQLLVLNGFGTASDEQARLNAMNNIRSIDLSSSLVAGASNIMQQAVDLGKAFNVNPTLNTVFPNTSLGNQLWQVAKLIKFNSTASAPLSRQIFFCSLGGFDTHQNQVATQSTLLTQVGQAMKAFYDATVELQVDSKVVTFTLSDFSRTFQPSGSAGNTVGTDHAWGNYHLVMGGSVFGGDFYGVPGLNGTVFPTLQLSGPDDTDTRGRWIPTTSVDQYAATLASWFGVDATNINSVFPELKNFSIQRLAFL